jgi:DNA recombination-dependent growth factor C
MILSGTFSGRRFRAEGKVPPNPGEQFAKALRRHAFAPIDPASDRTRALGWVNPRQILDAAVTWHRCEFGGWIVLGLRADQRRVSRPILRARLAQAEADRLRERGRERIGREERAQLAKAIEAEMLAQTPPTTTVHELAWNPTAGVVWFSSTAQRANEEMQDLFEKTFDMHLVPLVPFTVAERWTDTQGRGGAALDRAAPTDLRARG